MPKKAGLYFRGFIPTHSRVQLFLSLNDLAGRWPLLDEAARVFYVGVLPFLGTLLLAQLLLLPPSDRVSRSQTALAVVLGLALGALVSWGFDWFAAQMNLGVLSPRPWMTRRVNWLVVEPQDSSFPCVEIVLASVLAGASWRLNRRFGTASALLVIVFALVRMFCGNNYLADVLVGIALGAGCFALCAAVCERHESRGQRARSLGLGAMPLVATLVGCYCFALTTPRFGSKLGIGQSASAAPVAGTVASVSSAIQGEGEGMAPEEGSAEELALAKRSTLFLPQVESFLRGRLTPVARPFKLLDVEAAPVKAGTSSFRCAAIRFEVPVGGSQTRRLVADRAARLVKTAFALDSHLQSVDIIAVALDEGRDLDGSNMIFAGDEVPVFTASVQRKNLILASPAWLNAPGVDRGSWLRARSRIYINTRALPYSPAPRAAPQLTPQSPSPMPQVTKTSPSPTANATVKPTSRPTKPTPTATPRLEATPSNPQPQPSRMADKQPTATNSLIS